MRPVAHKIPHAHRNTVLQKPTHQSISDYQPLRHAEAMHCVPVIRMQTPIQPQPYGSIYFKRTPNAARSIVARSVKVWLAGERGFRDFSRLPSAQENRGQPTDPASPHQSDFRDTRTY